MTNRPKGKLFALLAIFAAIGIVTATGAFTSVQAERTVEVTTAGDASALVALTDAGQGYVDTSGSQVTIDFGSNGANIRADTDFGAVLNITNNAPSGETIYVQIATKATNTSYTSGTLFEDSVTEVDPEWQDSNGNSIEGGDQFVGGNQLTIGSGNTSSVHVTLSVDSVSPTTYSGSIVIVAEDSDLTQ